MNLINQSLITDTQSMRLSIARSSHSGNLKQLGPKRLPTSRPNAELLPPETYYERLIRADPSNLTAATAVDSEYFIRLMFPDQNQLVCMGPDVKSMTTNYLWAFNLAEAHPSFIVPAYMNRFVGMTVGYPRGTGEQKLSFRCSANTGNARFVVYCGEQRSLEDQAYGIIRLALEAPLVMVVMTGRGVLNAWYSVIDWSERDVKSLRWRARQFGSWSKTGIACHPYPFPGGSDVYPGRDCYEGTLVASVHRTVYFDPAAIGTKVNLFS